MCPQELFRATHPRSRPSKRLFKYAKALALLGGSAAGFSLAALGFCLLFGLFTLRMLSPSADQYSAELLFDFTQPLAIATARLQSGVALKPAQLVWLAAPTHVYLQPAPIVWVALVPCICLLAVLACFCWLCSSVYLLSRLACAGFAAAACRDEVLNAGQICPAFGQGAAISVC